MKRIVFRKGTKTRTVWSPDRQEKQRLLELLPVIAAKERDLALQFGCAAVAHGFIAGRSPVTCAMQHIGYDVTVSVDIKNWFDSVRRGQIPLPPSIREQVLWRDRPRQGLPTSPAVCNLAAVEMDNMVLWNLQRHLRDYKWVYTRYADDLTVSFSGDHDLCAIVHYWLTVAVTRMGWKLNLQKTRVQTANAGRRIIVGVSVGPEDIQPTRETKRRLRAGEHNTLVIRSLYAARRDPRVQRFNGLAEWAALKVPRAARTDRQIPGLLGGGGIVKPVKAATPVGEVIAISTGDRHICFGG